MLEHVQDQINNEEIVKSLQAMPPGLSESYDSVLSRINKMPSARRLLAHKVFFWINVARRLLKVKELCAILAVKP